MASFKLYKGEKRIFRGQIVLSWAGRSQAPGVVALAPAWKILPIRSGGCTWHFDLSRHSTTDGTTSEDRRDPARNQSALLNRNQRRP
jgi:hypothetical protein